LASDEPDAEAPASESGIAAFPFTGDAAATGGQSPVGLASLRLSHSAAAIAAADPDASPLPPR
jgi:hypothetical protein